MSLEVCDRIAVSIGNIVKDRFKDSFTSTSIEESSEKITCLWLVVSEQESQKRSVWAIVEIRCGRLEARTWNILAWIRTTVIHKRQSDQRIPSIGDIVGKYRSLRLHATTTTEYHPRDRVGGIGLSWTEFSFPLADLETTADGPEREAIYDNLGHLAIERLVASREIRDSLEAEDS
jgi:hypothetical protein